ncbi:TPA: hypothetical protein ACX6S1_000194 [Photobacterium damselae]
MEYEYYLEHKEQIDYYMDSMFCRYYSKFSKVYFINDGHIGCAQYLALLAYPSPEEGLDRNKFSASMISAYCRVNNNDLLNTLLEQPKTIQDAWLIKKPWKSIDQTISKGVKRLQKRLQAYHAYSLHNQSVIENKKQSFEHCLSLVSTAYESNRSKLQDDKDRISNLKRIIHRPSRPIYHLIQGYYDEHLVRYPLDIRHPYEAILNTLWLEPAIITARRKLSSELLDYHLHLNNMQKQIKTTIIPNEVIHLELNSKPFTGLFT